MRKTLKSIIPSCLLLLAAAAQLSHAQQAVPQDGVAGVAWRSGKAEVFARFGGEYTEYFCKPPVLPANPTAAQRSKYEAELSTHSTIQKLKRESHTECGWIESTVLIGKKAAKAMFSFTADDELYTSLATIDGDRFSAPELVGTYVNTYQDLVAAYGRPASQFSHPITGAGHVTLVTETTWRIRGTLIVLELTQRYSESTPAMSSPRLSLKHSYLPLACPRHPKMSGC